MLLIDWHGPAEAADGAARFWNGVRVVRCTPRWVDGFGKLARNVSKFVLSGPQAGRIARKAFDLDGFDAFITWAPALAIAPVVAMARRADIAHRLLFIWDFFPDHLPPDRPHPGRSAALDLQRLGAEPDGPLHRHACPPCRRTPTTCAGGSR